MVGRNSHHCKSLLKKKNEKEMGKRDWFRLLLPEAKTSVKLQMKTRQINNKECTTKMRVLLSFAAIHPYLVHAYLQGKLVFSLLRFCKNLCLLVHHRIRWTLRNHLHKSVLSSIFACKSVLTRYL